MALDSTSEPGWWLDRWWPLMVILFGILFVAVLVTFNPVI